MQILWITSARLGDALFGTPALHWLKKNQASTAVDVLVPSPIAAEIFSNNPCVRSIIQHDPESPAEDLFRKYDMILHPNSDLEDWVAAWNSAHHGHSPILSPEKGRKNMHKAAEQLAFICRTFELPSPESPILYQIFPRQSDFDSSQKLVTENADNSSCPDVQIVCSIGCNRLALTKNFWKGLRHKKVWPHQRIVELIRLLDAQIPNAKVILIGSGNESAIARKIKRKAGSCINLVGKTSIMEMTALMKTSHCSVLCDSGPMHIAAATEIPIIGLFGHKTSPEITGPYPLTTELHTILRKDNIEEIRAESVLQAIQNILS